MDGAVIHIIGIVVDTAMRRSRRKFIDWSDQKQRSGIGRVKMFAINRQIPTRRSAKKGPTVNLANKNPALPVPINDKA
jgi:hypothetical protein